MSVPAGTLEDVTGIGEQLAVVAAGRRAAFDGMHAASGPGRVHAVESVEILGQLWPAPLCHTAILGGELARLEPTATAITCQRCLRVLGVHQDHPMLSGLESMLGASTQTA